MIKKITKVCKHPNPDGWLITTTKNYILKCNTKHQSINQIDFSEQNEDYISSMACGYCFDVDIDYISKETLETVNRCLKAKLSNKDYNLFKLYFYDGFTISEISVRLNCKIETAYVRLHRLKSKIDLLLKTHKNNYFS